MQDSGLRTTVSCQLKGGCQLTFKLYLGSLQFPYHYYHSDKKGNFKLPFFFWKNLRAGSNVWHCVLVWQCLTRFGASPCSGPGTGHEKSPKKAMFAQQTITGRRRRLAPNLVFNRKQLILSKNSSSLVKPCHKAIQGEKR